MTVNLQNVQSQADAASSAVLNAPANAQAAWNQATSPQANQARIDAGVSAAQGLIANGYDPDNPSDNQALISVYAGAVSCLVPAGPILGGALEVLAQVGQFIGTELQDLGIIPKPGCKSSGNWSTASILAAFVASGADTTPGTFGALAWPALAYDACQQMQCQPSYGQQAIVAGLAALWNKSAKGTPAPVWWPAQGASFLGYGTTSTASAAQVAAQKALTLAQAQANAVGPMTDANVAAYNLAQQAVARAQAALAAAGKGTSIQATPLASLFKPTATAPAPYPLDPGTISLAPGPYTPLTFLHVMPGALNLTPGWMSALAQVGGWIAAGATVTAAFFLWLYLPSAPKKP